MGPNRPMSRAAHSVRSKRPPIAAGQRYGRLVALKFVGRVNTDARWLFRCDCGRLHETGALNVKRGNVKSCGCLRAELARRLPRTTHGMTKSPEYQLWRNITQKCFNPRSTQYHAYGGRGLTVCKRWRRFENFYADVGPRPSPSHSLRRINHARGYDPRNCRWAVSMTAGQRFGRLVSVGFVDRRHGHARWLFRCDCGNKTVIAAKAAKSGNTSSCGCLKRETGCPIDAKSNEG
jgi:hypothetical protein